MFGRKEESYEEYNERYAAKYDDDYIKPSHEYRAECYHEHEQTYEDYNSEQREYDEASSIASKFTNKLMPNEHTIWTGKSAANGCSVIFAVLWIGFSVIWTIGSVFSDIKQLSIGIFLTAAGVIMLRAILKGGKTYYMITDMRILTITGGRFKGVRLETISKVTFSKTGNDTGTITYYYANGAGAFLNGVKEPEKVSRILQDAVYSSKIRQE